MNKKGRGYLFAELKVFQLLKRIFVPRHRLLTDILSPYKLPDLSSGNLRAI